MCLALRQHAELCCGLLLFYRLLFTSFPWMPYKIQGRETFAVCCRCFFWSRTTHRHLPFSSLFIPNVSLLLLPFSSPSESLSNQIHLSPSLGQSHHIQTWGWSEEGNRRRRDHIWDFGLSDKHPTRSITRREKSHWTPSTVLLPELDIIHDYRLLKNDCFLLQWTKGADLSGTHFVIFVTPLAILLCQPFGYEQRVSGDIGSV